MVDAVAAQSILLATMAGALVVVLGAAYAFLFAWARVHAQPRLLPWAYFSFLLMTGAVVVLATTLNLVGHWGVLVGVMLVGYLLAPHAIWWLCVQTHRDESNPSPATLDRSVEQ